MVQYTESFVEDDVLHIVMQYCGCGDLATLIKRTAKEGGYLEEGQILDWFLQLAFGVAYIHSRRILHRDLKTSNVFITTQNTVKLGDFGIARVLDSTLEQAKTVVGTPYYMSPEVCENKPYRFKSDLWALGCILYEMCTLKHAFDATNLLGLVFKIVQDKAPPIPDRYSPELRDLVSRMLCKDPDERIDIEQIFELPFIKERMRLMMEARRRAAAGDSAPADGDFGGTSTIGLKTKHAMTHRERIEARRAAKRAEEEALLKRGHAEAKAAREAAATYKEKSLRTSVDREISGANPASGRHSGRDGYDHRPPSGGGSAHGGNAGGAFRPPSRDMLDDMSVGSPSRGSMGPYSARGGGEAPFGGFPGPDTPGSSTAAGGSSHRPKASWEDRPVPGSGQYSWQRAEANSGGFDSEDGRHGSGRSGGSSGRTPASLADRPIHGSASGRYDVDAATGSFNSYGSRDSPTDDGGKHAEDGDHGGASGGAGGDRDLTPVHEHVFGATHHADEPEDEDEYFDDSDEFEMDEVDDGYTDRLATRDEHEVGEMVEWMQQHILAGDGRSTDLAAAAEAAASEVSVSSSVDSSARHGDPPSATSSVSESRVVHGGADRPIHSAAQFRANTARYREQLQQQYGAELFDASYEIMRPAYYAGKIGDAETQSKLRRLTGLSKGAFTKFGMEMESLLTQEEMDENRGK